MESNDLDDDLAMLLPFYVNGGLSPADVVRIENALQHSAALRAELAEVQALQHSVRYGGDALSAPMQASTTQRLEKLLERIDATTAPAVATHAQPIRTSVRERESLWASLFSFRWKPAFAAAAAALVVLQSGTIGYFALRNKPANYGTLSGPVESAAKATIMLQLKAGARWFDIQALLTREDLHIVDGPIDSSLALAPNQPMTEAQTNSLIERLKVSPIVTFAGAAS